jgi:hypothetical protein
MPKSSKPVKGAPWAGTASLGRIAGVSAMVAFLVGIVSAVLFLAWGDFNVRTLFEPARQLEPGPSSRGSLLRWAALTDMLSYYLPLIPLFVWTGAFIRPRAGALSDLATAGGVLYAGIGAVAAGVLAAAGPPLLDEASRTTGTAHHQAALLYTALANGVYVGAWQTVEILPLGLWAVIVGLALRPLNRTLGTIGVGLAVVCVAASTLRMVGGHPSIAVLIPASVLFAGLFWLFVLGLALGAFRHGSDVLRLP